MTAATYVKEFITRAVGHEIDTSFILDALRSVKTPLIVTIGIAAVAGLVYLAYKLYKNWNPSLVKNTLETIMADIRDIAPSIVGVPGWLEEIRARVSGIISGSKDDPAAMVSQLAEMRADLMDKQARTNPKAAGSGIDMVGRSAYENRHIRGKDRSKRRAHRGGGLVAG
jgi:hypothetical protein